MIDFAKKQRQEDKGYNMRQGRQLFKPTPLPRSREKIIAALYEHRPSR